MGKVQSIRLSNDSIGVYLFQAAQQAYGSSVAGLVSESFFEA